MGAQDQASGCSSLSGEWYGKRSVEVRQGSRSGTVASLESEAQGWEAEGTHPVSLGLSFPGGSMS